MKKISVVFTIILAIAIFYPISALAVEDIQVSEYEDFIEVNIQTEDIKDECIPVKPIFRKAGYEVIKNYEGLIIMKPIYTGTFTIGENEIAVENKKVIIKLPFRTIGERLYISKKLAEDILREEIQYAHKIPALLYHHLLRKDENSFGNNSSIIDVEKFEEQMKFLYDNGYYTITPEELEKYLEGEIMLPQKSILITFDDGYKSNIYYGYDILKRYNFRGTIFMITDAIQYEETTFNPYEIQYVSWNEIERSRDVFTFGSHTHNLHQLNDQRKSFLVCKSKEEIMKDLKLSMEVLDTKYLAYPYGQYNEETIKMIKKLGFSLGFNIKKGNIKEEDNKFGLNRFSIYPNTTLNRFKKMVQ